MRRNRTNNILTKEEFVEMMAKIQKAVDFDRAVEELYWVNGYQSPEHPDLYWVLIKVLDSMFYVDDYKNDAYFVSDIDYFCVELDFGRKYEPGCITYADGTEIDISTSEKLYDYLMEAYVNNED